MVNLLQINNLHWDDTLTSIVIWAIPVTLFWFCWRLYRFCSASQVFKKSGPSRLPKYHDHPVNEESSEWDEYTRSTTGIPGVPPEP